MVTTDQTSKKTAIGGNVPTNGAEGSINDQIPYVAQVTIQGVADLLFHRYNCEEVRSKSEAKKGSKTKKTDNVESFVYRNEAGELCIPGEYLRMAVINTAKYLQDPRSTRKSAMDLFKAAIVPLTPLCSLGVKDWDYEHACRVVIQRSAVTRIRPAMKSGWKITCQLLCNLPEYVSPELLNEAIQMAGRLNGIADFRPTYGRFQVVNFNLVNPD